MRFEKHSFGPVLRAVRERRGVTLAQLAAETKVSVELWAALEDNALSRWPKRLYARSYLRDYAVRIGLDPEEVVNEFCRLFPEEGNRRAESLLRGQAAIVDHELSWEDLPAAEQRRASDRPVSETFLSRHGTRCLAAGIDMASVLGLAALGLVLEFRFWPSLALSSVAYHAVGTLVSSRSFGAFASEWIWKIFHSMPAVRRLISTRVEGS